MLWAKPHTYIHNNRSAESCRYQPRGMMRAVQFLFLLSVAIGHSLCLAAKPNIGKELFIAMCIQFVIIGGNNTDFCTVYIITDDQDIKLDSLSVQPQVKSLLIDKGMFFQNAFVTTPVCCPSRYI